MNIRAALVIMVWSLAAASLSLAGGASAGRQELDSQFAALSHDLNRRGHFSGVSNQTCRPEALILPGDRDPADVILRRTASLLAALKKAAPPQDLDGLGRELAALREKNAAMAVTDTGARRSLFDEACALRRRIAFANPLLSFERLLFIKRDRAVYNHMCDQFYGIAAAPGGGLYILEMPFGEQALTDVLANAVVESGRLQGRKLSGGPLPSPRATYNGNGARGGTESGGGTFLSPSLSPDGNSVLFAYAENTGDPNHVWHGDSRRGHWDAGRCYHLFRVGVDGRGLQQLTDGTWNEFDPCWLPNGRIAFISERRGGYLRCGRVCPLYTLYDMAADGSAVNALSFHESNEWNPSVTHDGRIVYTRWDYVDRHGCVAHVPWLTSLDGRDSRSLHGNFAPRPLRPDMELAVRAIPNSRRFMAVAAPHHGQAFGSIIVIDPSAPDDDAMGPVKRFTPEVAFPESEGGREAYGTPWPLSEDFCLCIYDASMQYGGGRGNYGLYLVDSFGNRELIYRDPDIACASPIPVRRGQRPAPSAVATQTMGESQAVSPGATGEATLAVVNVYDSLTPWPAGTRIHSLRVLQLLPMSVPSGNPPHETGKRMAEAKDSVLPCRWVLGTVPVEADGSAHFTVPAYREVFFQALDEAGLAVQSMRSATYARAGERLLCQGCHESKSKAPAASASVPLALRRSPSMPQRDVSGSYPYSYPLLVQPVLDRNCVGCHDAGKDKGAPNLHREPLQNKWYASYNSLLPFAFTSYGAQQEWRDPRWYRTTPGRFGARASRLYPMLAKGHHDLKLSAEDLHRIALWLDCGSAFYGVYDQEGGEAQLRGELATPALE